jgi:hypothetical protein
MTTQIPSREVEVLNPEAELRPSSEGKIAKMPASFLAPRLDTLSDKTIYLVNQGFGGSALFMEQVAGWLAEHIPTAKVIQKRKTGFIFRDDTSDLWQEIKEKGGDAVIFGVAG